MIYFEKDLNLYFP